MVGGVNAWMGTVCSVSFVNGILKEVKMTCLHCKDDV